VETTQCPDTRRLVPFQAPRRVLAEMAQTFQPADGKGEASGRRAWMKRRRAGRGDV
jgi:topoisomerase-4 subunit B